MASVQGLRVLNCEVVTGSSVLHQMGKLQTDPAAPDTARGGFDAVKASYPSWLLKK